MGQQPEFERDGVATRLMQRVAGGDRSALAALFESEAGRLIAIAQRILRRRELAEEAVQDAFVSAWARAASFDPGQGSARIWLTAILRNRALNMLRDGARLDFVEADELALLGDRAGEADSAWAALPEGLALRRCLEALEPRRRTAILLSYVVGFSHGEVAARIGCPIGTAKAWIRRGMIALQECMA